MHKKQNKQRQAMSSPTLTILSLLDVYSQIHELADQSQKACTWQITKARQNKSRRGALITGAFMAEDVREELRATTRLQQSTTAAANDDDGVALVDEDSATATKASKNNNNNKKALSLEDELPLTRHFTLMNVNDEAAVTQNNDDNNKNNKDQTADGLRRRKGVKENDKANDTATATTTGKEQWNVSEGVDPEKEEERLLLSADPIDLFGAMPPAELRKAQAEARKALAGYVEAANLLAAIQKQLVLAAAAADKKN